MNQRAQSTFEYILLVAAVVAVVVAFVNSPYFRGSVKDVMDNSVTQLARETEGIDFHIPGAEEDFDQPVYPPGAPEGWTPPPQACSYGLSQWTIPLIGLDDHGFPIFSDRFVGNPGWHDPECDEPLDSEEYMTFGDGGVLFFRLGLGAEWTEFDWNNVNHIREAYQYQRYGRCEIRGAPGMHSSDYLAAFRDIYGRDPSCEELYDHYFGKLRAQGLTGRDADLNGLELISAAAKKNFKEAIDPNSPSYMGTPQEPGEFNTGWDREGWITAYCRIKSLGLQPHYNFADIEEAFPGGGSVPGNACSQ